MYDDVGNHRENNPPHGRVVPDGLPSGAALCRRSGSGEGEPDDRTADRYPERHVATGRAAAEGINNGRTHRANPKADDGTGERWVTQHGAAHYSEPLRF